MSGVSGPRGFIRRLENRVRPTPRPVQTSHASTRSRTLPSTKAQENTAQVQHLRVCLIRSPRRKVSVPPCRDAQDRRNSIGMARRVALVSFVLAACVGDDPVNPPAADGGITPDSGTPVIDSGSGTETSTPIDASNDAGSDAGSCLAPAANMISWWTGDDTFMDRLQANNMVQAGSTGTVSFGAGHVGKAMSFDGSRLLERQVPIGISSLGGFTVEAWVKQDTSANKRILDRSTA